MSERATTSEALPARLVGSVVRLSPTTLFRWHRCRRLYLLRNLLQLPAVDRGPWANEGLKVHAVLHHLHQHGSCRERDDIEDAVATYARGDEERLRGFLERHRDRCPDGAVALGHEVGRARLHRSPPPVFLAAATIDAIWVHGPWVDARDYKTGGGHDRPLADDPRARVQAWLLAPLAAERGLRLRLRYEYLAPETPEDPPPFEPDDDTLRGIEEELRATAEAMREERDFLGVADPVICRTCEFRSICDDAVLDETVDVDDADDAGNTAAGETGAPS